MTPCVIWLNQALTVLEEMGEFSGFGEGLSYWYEELSQQVEWLDRQNSWSVADALTDYCVHCLEVCQDLWDATDWSGGQLMEWRGRLAEAQLSFRSAEEHLREVGSCASIYA